MFINFLKPIKLSLTCNVTIFSSICDLQLKNEAPTVGAICGVNIFSMYLVIVDVLPTPVNNKKY